MDAKTLRKKTSVSLPGDLLREANLVARKHGISLSEYVKRVVLPLTPSRLRISGAARSAAA